MIVVDDPDDPRLDHFRWRERRLARADKLSVGAGHHETVGAGMFVAEGDLVVARAADVGCEAVAVLCAPQLFATATALIGNRAPIYCAVDAVRREVTGLGVPLELVGLFRRPAPRQADDLCVTSRRLVVLEGVDNPTNVGAVARSAAALGWDGLLLDPTSADPLSRRALRVSMGLGLMIPFARLAAGNAVHALLRPHGFRSVALTPSTDAVSIEECVVDAAPLALLLGSERHGLSGEMLSDSDVRVRIPMRTGVDSLNVAAAAAVALHVLGPCRRA